MRGTQYDRDYCPISLNWFKKSKNNTNVNNDLKQKNMKKKMLPSKIYSDNDTKKKKKSHKVKRNELRTPFWIPAPDQERLNNEWHKKEHIQTIKLIYKSYDNMKTGDLELWGHKF